MINEIESSIILNYNSKLTTIIEPENSGKYYEIMSIIQNLINLLNNETIKKTKIKK